MYLHLFEQHLLHAPMMVVPPVLTQRFSMLVGWIAPAG